MPKKNNTVPIILLTAKGHKEDRIMHDHRIVHHDYIDYGNHIQVIVKHRPHLTKYERKRIKRWCHRHYGHHKKRISYKFVIVG